MSPAGNGICHSLYYSRFGVPGTLLLGADSRNLINFGILPLEFESTGGYDEISQNSVLLMERVHRQVSTERMAVKNLTQDKEIQALCRLTERERAIVLSGGL